MKSLPSEVKNKALNALTTAIKIAGGQSSLARKCAVRPQTIQVWVKMGRVPAERAIQVEEIVGFTVSRHDLRPDIYPRD